MPKPKKSMSEPLLEGAASSNEKPSHYMINLVHLSMCFFLVFTAFSAIQNLAASEYRTAWIGSVSVAILYVFFTLFCIIGPFIYQKLGIKWSIFSALAGYTAYAATNMVAVYFNTCIDDDDGKFSWLIGQVEQNFTCKGNFDINKSPDANNCSTYGIEARDSGSQWTTATIPAKGSFATCCACGGGDSPQLDKIVQIAVLFPGAAICGISASFLWTAQGSYVTENARKYHGAKHPEDIGDATKMKQSIGLFNGIFFGFFQATQITGNLVAGILRSAGLKDIFLFLIYVVCAVLGTGLALCLRKIPKPSSDEPPASLSTELLATLKLIVNSKMMSLLIPLIMYNGLEMGFIWGDYTKYYADVGLGSSNMPFVMVAFGGADVLASVGFGKLSDVIGRGPIIAIGAVVQLVVLIATFFYNVPKLPKGTEPDSTVWIMLMAGAVLWGIGDAVWNTQLMAILGDRFPDQPAAFANLKLWQALATSIAFFYNSVFSTFLKKIILIVFLGLGLVGYIASECVARATKKSNTYSFSENTSNKAGD